MTYDIEKLKRERLIKGLSCQRLSMMAGLDPQAVWRMEHAGSTKPETVKKIADMLGVPMEALLREQSLSPNGKRKAAK